MLIRCKDHKEIRDLSWAGIELSSELNTEETVLRILRWCLKHVTGPWEVFFPADKRTRKGVSMLGPYVYIRAWGMDKLALVGSLYGVQGLLTDHERKIIPVDKKFIRGLMAELEEKRFQASKGIKKGSFVRILHGSMRMLCGEVAVIRGSKVRVTVPMISRTLQVWINKAALQNLGKVKESEKQFFYTGAEL